ncbi:type IX secretion system protein PorQ [Xylanibacter oryzae]|uniref:type IX secretion system protein PorQ n=1 Tax=Xylanibacter oryzae TaxID=185293 RepID=UPI00056612CC|nr:type IX secretion system protein PorQ [Xylanibacter oryzae]MBP7359160.1 type IX secretion system protein PorQ [Prevotella sp.]
MKKAVFCLLFTLFTVQIVSQESQNDYNFLRLPVSAHAAALGGDNISIIKDDATLMFNNPALISSVSDKTINLNFMSYMEGTKLASASFTKIINDKATWAVSAQYIDYGNIKEVTEDNIEQGTFSAKDISIAGYFAYTLSNKIVGGITAKCISSHIAGYNSLAMGVDLGLNYYDDERDLSVSAVAKNLGGQLKAYDETYEGIPLDLQIGASKRVINSPFRFSATIVDLNHWDYSFINHMVAGLDLILSDNIYLSCGYNFRRAHEMKITDSDNESSSHGAGFSFGGGIELERFKLQLSYGKYHVSSSSILVNVSYSL